MAQEFKESPELEQKLEAIRKEAAEKKALRKDNKKRSTISWIFMPIFIGMFLFSAYKLISIYGEYRKNAKNVQELQTIFHAAEAIEHTESSVTQLNGEGVHVNNKETAYSYTAYSLEPLKEINPDTVAWLTIPAADVDHVVVQGTNNSFYLYRSFYEEPNNCGTLFMDYRVQIGQPLQNYVIYGHHLRDGSMFSHLFVFQDQETYNANPSFTIVLEDGEYEAQIFSAFSGYTTDDYDIIQFESPEEMEEFIAKFRAKSEVQCNVEVTAEDKILTLSTCDKTNHGEQGRFVVMAKLVKIGEE